MRILNNVFLDSVRRYEHKHLVSINAPSNNNDKDWTEFLPGNDPDPAEAAIEREDEQRARRALASLPACLRVAVTLCDIEKMSYARIADILECPVGTVRSRIHRGRLRLVDGFSERREASPRLELAAA
jgi:RNA polymerase sigma-70 factor (ECF subfamily)